jgi:predicted DCC family thiol-disulfide oxidoreductase YuxK
MANPATELPLPVDPREHPIVLFDGVCSLCEGVVRFSITRDPDARLRFTPLQSELGRMLLQHYGFDLGSIDAVVLVDADGAHDRSTAVLRLAGHLRAPWRWLGRPLLWIPRRLRDVVYDFVARHRFHWFGRRDACLVPTPELRARFL